MIQSYFKRRIETNLHVKMTNHNLTLCICAQTLVFPYLQNKLTRINQVFHLYKFVQYYIDFLLIINIYLSSHSSFFKPYTIHVSVANF